MYFAHDQANLFYYGGVEPPNSRTLNKFLVDNPPHLIACDVETISLKERIAIGIGIAVSPEIAFYFQLFPTASSLIPWNLLKDPSVTSIWHNGIFDLGCLIGYEVNQDIQDTNIMARLLCHKYNGLLDLSWVHQMEVHDVKDLLKEHNSKTMLELPPDVVASKCMQDAMATFRLYQVFLPQTNLAYYNVERATIPIMLKMSDRGILLDQEYRQQVEIELESEVVRLDGLCNEVDMFNPGSPQQVSYILSKRGAYRAFHRLPFTRNKYGRSTNQLSTAEEILERMDDPLAQIILEYRRKSKLLNTYIKPWAKEERASTRYHLDAITGRPSSTDRNMQNIPGVKSRLGINARGCLLPDSGIWTDMDFSQLELRILAWLSQDREMLHIYEQPRFLPDGSPNPKADIHQITADFMAIDRKICKNINFAMVYGGSDETLAETAHIKSKQRATQLREMWFNLFPQAGDYITSTNESVARGRKTVSTVFGRNMRLPDEEEDSLGGRQRKAIDYPCQGTAADILKRALLVCQSMDIALQIHDELLIDGLELPERFGALEHIAPFPTPIEVKYLEHWE